MKLFKYILYTFLATIPNFLLSQNVAFLPSIAYVYPAGAKQGTSLDIIIGGKKFNNITDVIVSGEGVKCTITKSLLPKERNPAIALRNKLQGLLVNKKLIKPDEINNFKAKNAVDYSQHPELEELREQIDYENKLHRLGLSSQTAFAQTIHIKLDIDKDAKLGRRTIKLISADGASNPMPFYIDNLDEYSERSIRDRSYNISFNVEKGLLPAEVLKNGQSKYFPKQDTEIQDVKIPVIINGQVDLLQTDIFRFEAKKGQEIVAFVRARDLIYYIADGVPGWFQAAISIKDSSGKEIAYVDDYYQNPDPLLTFVAPKTDEYTLEIKDAIYRGREDFVYRIILGELPFITRIYPLGGDTKLNKKVNIYGFNLNRKQADIKQDLSPSYNELNLANKGEQQSKLLYQATSLKSIDFSKASNTSKAKAEPVSLHQSINSILKNQEDKHFYSFQCKENKRVILEVFARRLGSPIDTFLELFDSDMKLIASNDDFEDFSDGLNTHHADSKIDFNAKANQLYYIRLRDTQNKAGDSYAYRLNIYEPKADFEAKASPSTINIVQGKSTPFNVSIFRKNEGKFPVEIKLKKAPKGVSISGTEIEPNSDNVMVVLSCDKDVPLGMNEIELEAVSNYEGNKITKRIIPCEDMLQAFYYPHLVPTSSHNIYVISPNVRTMYRDVNNIKSIEERGLVIPEEIEIKLGGEKQLYIGSFGVVWKKGSNIIPIHAELRDSSQGITIEKIEHNEKRGCTITFKSNPEICKVGQSANLIVDIFMNKKEGTKLKRVKIDTLKAIKYIIVK